MKLVILESPFAATATATVEEHIAYARQCLRDCLQRGESPIASHLLFTQEGVLQDAIPEERALGIAAGVAWQRVADYSVFYIDFGWSKGMLAARDKLMAAGRSFEVRMIGGEGA